MKKQLLLLFTLILMICVVCTACSSTKEPTEETSAHTLPPTEATIAEPEWVEVDCDIALVDSDGAVVVPAVDFETFALVGTNDDDSYIKIKLNDSGYMSLIEYTSITSNTFYLYLNGEEIEEITYADDVPNPIELGHDMSYQELCELATTIRGLFN
ncbi:MAG: hypothetical protein E7513_05590 [Ruminococcaceae bacterium]|nr:hypothetical protein [Oscillospiraceae bacterium]